MTNDNSPYALVVDDDAIILLAASDILEQAGFRPLEAYDADEAVHRLEAFSNEIALLFTDVDLGKGNDGFWLARETSVRWPKVKILVASGHARPTDSCLPSGAQFIQKPFTAQVVHDRLRELLPDGQKPEPLGQKASS